MKYKLEPRSKRSKDGRGEVRIVITVVAFISAGVCAVGWLSCWVGTAALIKYMADKGCAPPSSEEMKAYCAYALKKLLHIQN